MSTAEHLLHGDLTDKILACAHKVYYSLGGGFLEKLYENAMLIELKKLGLKVEQQKVLRVFYEGAQIGEFYPDLVVDDVVIVELKAVADVSPVHEAQLINYLRASGLEVGLLLNFGDTLGIRRKMYTH